MEDNGIPDVRASGWDVEGRLFAAAFENAPIGMALVGLDGQWLRVNRALVDMFGYTREEFLGKTFQDFTHPDDLHGDLENLGKVICGKIKVYQMEKRYVARKGRIIWALLTASLVRDARGEPVHFISQILDITERKSLEQRLLLMQRMEGLDVRIQSIVQDATSSLSPIVSEVGILRQSILSPEALALADSIELRAGQCLNLMSQILPHIQGYSEQRIALKIEDVLDEVSRITHITSARPLSIKTHCEDDLWLVEGDRVQLTQTFLIFCLNARDAIGHGEGDLTLSAANTVIGPGHPLADQAPAPGNYVTVQVNDTGCGMTPDVLARIYEPFFTTKLPKKGTGLGLPAAREILHSHGGFLQVSSQAGQGTQITAGLPAVKYAPQKNLKKNSGQTRQPG